LYPDFPHKRVSYTQLPTFSSQAYSYRIASSGLRAEARLAGKIPVKYPTPAEKIAIKAKNVMGNENSVTA
jgi:hypothetical protein